MKIFFFDDKPIELDIDKETLWKIWRAVKHGTLEVKIRVPFGKGSMIPYDLGRIDSRRTFETFNSQEIPPSPDTLRAPPPSSIGEDQDDPSRH